MTRHNICMCLTLHRPHREARTLRRPTFLPDLRTAFTHRVFSFHFFVPFFVSVVCVVLRIQEAFHFLNAASALAAAIAASAGCRCGKLRRRVPSSCALPSLSFSTPAKKAWCTFNLRFWCIFNSRLTALLKRARDACTGVQRSRLDLRMQKRKCIVFSPAEKRSGFASAHYADSCERERFKRRPCAIC